MIAARHILACLTAAALATAPLPALADPWKDESGHGRGHGNRGGYEYEEKYVRGGRVKHEWRSGDCKYEYKAGPEGVKEEYKCGGGGRRGGPPAHAGPPSHAGPPAWTPPGHRGHTYTTSLPQPPLDLSAGRCNRELIGQLLGGAAGAAAGSQIGDGRGRIAAIIGGAVAGVFLGGEIGRTMDRADHLCFDQALEHAPDGRAVEWRNPDRAGGHQVMPRQTYQTDDGRYCREYTATSTVGGERVQTYGIACRQPDGSWRIVSQDS